MKYHVFFFFTIISFVSYSMHQPPILLLESADRVYRRNGSEVAKNYVDFINYLQIQYTHFVEPADLRSNLHRIGQSPMTTEEKKIALNKLSMLKAEVESIRTREKKRAEEDGNILAYFGSGLVDG